MTSTTARPTWRIVPTERADVPALVALGHLAFEHDRHTRMKMHEKGTEDLATELGGPEGFYQYLEHPRVRMVKAVDETGRIVGFTNWGLWNFAGDRTAVDPDSAFDAPIDIPVPPGTPLLQQLIDLNGGHLSAMEDRLLRGGKVVYCVGISVLPEVQSQGVGSALLGWATQLADENDASAWIHLSDNLGGVRALERKGFKEVNRLEVDLDHYATKPRPGGGVWGPYTFRYFRREAQRHKSAT